MDSRELYRLLEMPAAVVEKLNRCAQEIPLERAAPLIQSMLARESAAEAYEELRALLSEDEGCFRMLYCQLECARRCHAAYRARGISDEVFVDTMKCFRRFLLECERKTGEMAFDRGWWTYRQISMRIFRLGELEYELHEAEGEKSVHLHIPSDARFAPGDVDESLRRAADFMRRHYPEYAQAKRVCESWLLSPELARLLPERSNIRDFQRQFEIVEVDAQARDYMEWLFQAPGDAELSSLPENTRLQRAVKQHILNGGSIGAAYGVLM